MAKKKKPPPRGVGVVRTDNARKPKPKHKNPVVERIELASGGVYQLEYVRCGSVGCHCMKGPGGHGPYWYSYYVRASDGAWRSGYVGASPPVSTELGRELRNRRRRKKR